MTADRFGHAIDPTVGYARGVILASPTEETQRLRRCHHLIRERVARHGAASIGIFTGNRRDFLLRPEDLATMAEEWVGAALFAPALDAAIRAHLQAPEGMASAVFNRGSAALVATILALADHARIVSIVPPGERSHPSIRRGAALAGAALFEIDSLAALEDALRAPAALLIVTSVASSLARMAEADIAGAIALARRAGVPALVDDAYGARLRPVLHGGAPGFAHGADLVITNADKAGLHGPRAGILAGDPALVARSAARGAELGQEARAPIALGVLRGLEAWSPDDLRREAAEGRALATALAARLGAAAVRATDLGPLVTAEDVLSLALGRAQRHATALVPIESTAILGIFLLERHGILTTNIAGQPGAHIALRLKPTGGALQRCGGVEAVAGAVDGAIDGLAALVATPDQARAILLGAP